MNFLSSSLSQFIASSKSPDVYVINSLKHQTAFRMVFDVFVDNF